MQGRVGFAFSTLAARLSFVAAASLLAEYGRGVVIFEASDKVGGCCATTTLNGYTFSDDAVFVTVIGLLDHAFSRIGLKRSELLPLRNIVRPFAATLPDVGKETGPNDGGG